MSASAGAATGHYDVVVQDLARAQVMVSQTSAPDSDTTIVANAGSLTIGGVVVTVAGDLTLQQLAAAINGTSGIGVTAMVVRTGASSYRLALTSTDTDVAHAFTVSSTLTRNAGLTFADIDHDGVSGNSQADNAVNASDAAVLINNISSTSSSNVFQDIVPGVTLTVLKADPAATVAVDVATDGTALKTRITDFITAYNGLVAFIGEQRTAAANGEAASIGRDPVLRQLHATLRSALLAVTGSGTLTRLAEVGVKFTSSGQLTLDDTTFTDAVTTQTSAVASLVTGSAGAFGAVASLLDGYTVAGGLIPAGQRRLEQQIATLDDQIETMQRRLAIERDSLMRQFIEADTIMSRLRGQANSLAAFGSSLGSL